MGIGVKMIIGLGVGLANPIIPPPPLPPLDSFLKVMKSVAPVTGVTVT